MITLPRVASRIFGEPLAIDKAKLEIIVNAIAPRLQGMPMDDPEQRRPLDAGNSFTSDGICTIEISGTLVAKTTGMTAESGFTSYADIQQDFEKAQNDSSCRGIVLSINSPGGEVNGLFELADLMFQARGQKPVCAVVSCAASAAYLLASTADRILVSRTGITGSIGIIALHLDESQADAQAGLKYTAIYAGARKNDGNPHEPLTPEAKGSMQDRVDKIYGMFTAAVARNRDGILSEEAVRNTQAAIYLGQDGVTAGLADALGTPDDAARMLAAAIQKNSKSLYAGPIRAAETDCECPCESCMDGDCEECTHVNCDCANCVDCPMKDGAKAKAAHKISVAAATNSPKEAKKMAEIPVQAEAKVPRSAEIDAMVAEGTQAGRANASIIASMCAIAGKPHKIADYLVSTKTPAQVGAELLAEKVAADKETQVDPSVHPTTEAQEAARKLNAKKDEQIMGTAKPWSEIMGKLAGKKVA